MKNSGCKKQILSRVQCGIDAVGIIPVGVSQKELIDRNCFSRSGPMFPGDPLRPVKIEARNHDIVVSAAVNKEIWLFSDDRRFRDDGVRLKRPGSLGWIG